MSRYMKACRGAYQLELVPSHPLSMIHRGPPILSICYVPFSSIDSIEPINRTVVRESPQELHPYLPPKARFNCNEAHTTVQYLGLIARGGSPGFKTWPALRTNIFHVASVPDSGQRIGCTWNETWAWIRWSMEERGPPHSAPGAGLLE